jgi:glycosyltransferase involved in cell wall biosynthesis
MRLAYVITRGDGAGGAQVHVRDVAMAMQAAGHEVVVVCGGDQFFERTAPSLPVRATSTLRRPIAPLEDLRAVGEVARILRGFRPDLVSTHSVKAGVVGRLAARHLGIPAVHTLHGASFAPGIPASRRRMARAAERLLAPSTRQCIAVSDYDATLARTAGMSNIMRIHNGVPDVVERARPGTSGPVRLSMVARFAPQKDHETLLHALEELREPWQLDLIGTGPRFAQVRGLIDQLGLSDRVATPGEQTDIPERLGRSHLFVLSAHWEGLPRSILEAMRAGLPVVASDVGGVAEAVQHGVTGLVVPPRDPGLLGRAIGDLVRQPETRAQMGANGRRVYELHFGLDRCVTETEAVYRRVLHLPPVASPPPQDPP